MHWKYIQEAYIIKGLSMQRLAKGHFYLLNIRATPILPTKLQPSVWSLRAPGKKEGQTNKVDHSIYIPIIQKLGGFNFILQLNVQFLA